MIDITQLSRSKNNKENHIFLFVVSGRPKILLFDILELENVKFVHLIVGSEFYVIIVVTRVTVSAVMLDMFVLKSDK